MEERARIIELVKSLGITAEELGITPEVKRDEVFVREVRKLIDGESIDAEEARNYFREEYWKDLGIDEKKYKIVKCRMSKMIYKDIYVAMPEDEDEEMRIEEYATNLENLEIDYPNDEDDWDFAGITVDETDLTESEVRYRSRDGREIWNEDDFAD